MIAKANAKFIRISPRKVRQVADILRGKGVAEAFAILANVNKSATVYIEEILQSAVSNAKVKDADINPQNLYINKLTVDGGPSMVRYMAASMGRASMIRHRTSHINIELAVKAGVEKDKKKKVKRKKT